MWPILVSDFSDSTLGVAYCQEITWPYLYTIRVIMVTFFLPLDLLYEVTPTLKIKSEHEYDVDDSIHTRSI